jgi:uncharacterized protein YkwD
MRRRALILALGVAALAIGSSGPARAATHVDHPNTGAGAQSELIVLVNAYRANNGLQAVSSNSALTAAAEWMAGDMAAKNYIGHVSSDGRSPTQRMSAFGYPASSMYTGEDLAAGYGTASAVLAGWQASAAHNAVLLNPSYNAVGIGLVYNPSSTYKWYWAADFGGPGGTVKVVVPATPARVTQPVRAAAQPVPERAAPAPRGSAAQTDDSQPAAETGDAEAIAARATFADLIGERRIVHLLEVLRRMGGI